MACRPGQHGAQLEEASPAQPRAKWLDTRVGPINRGEVIPSLKGAAPNLRRLGRDRERDSGSGAVRRNAAMAAVPPAHPHHRSPRHSLLQDELSLFYPRLSDLGLRAGKTHVPCRRQALSCHGPPTTLELGVISSVQGRHEEEPSLVVVGGGAAGVYASIRAKTLAPHLNVAVVEKGRFLSKVKISGGGRCNVTNGHHLEPAVMRSSASYSYPGLPRWWCWCPARQRPRRRRHPASHYHSRVASNISAAPIVVLFAGTSEKLP